jgi:hypothetical protein
LRPCSEVLLVGSCRVLPPGGERECGSWKGFRHSFTGCCRPHGVSSEDLPNDKGEGGAGESRTPTGSYVPPGSEPGASTIPPQPRGASSNRRKVRGSNPQGGLLTRSPAFQAGAVASYRLDLPMVGSEGVEPSRPCGHLALNQARLPFRHDPKVLLQPAQGVLHQHVVSFCSVVKDRPPARGRGLKRRSPLGSWTGGGFGEPSETREPTRSPPSGRTHTATTARSCWRGRGW